MVQSSGCSLTESIGTLQRFVPETLRSVGQPFGLPDSRDAGKSKGEHALSILSRLDLPEEIERGLAAALRPQNGAPGASRARTA
jgi:hypothetical protein